MIARLEGLVRGGSAESQLALVEEPIALNPEMLALYRAMSRAWEEGSWEGDRDSWPDAIPDGRWALATTDHHHVGLRIGLARNPAVLVLLQTGVEDGVRDRVAHLVRMPFTNGFG